MSIADMKNSENFADMKNSENYRNNADRHKNNFTFYVSRGGISTNFI